MQVRWLITFGALLLLISKFGFAELHRSEPLSAETPLVIEAKGELYQIQSPLAGSAESSIFFEMSYENQQEFLKKREQFLKQIAKALDALKMGFGIGVLTKDRFKYELDEMKFNSTARHFQDLPEGARADFARAQQEARILMIQKQSELAARTLRERSHEVIQSILRGLDRNLWQQAPLFAHSNEYGIVLSLGIALLGGIEKRGGWGGLFDIGISLGYNAETKSVVIQVFRDFERFESTAMKAVFMTGIIGKAGMYVTNQTEGRLQKNGSTFYPPVIPGYSSTTPESFASGLSSGVTWPPSPLGDLLTYTNQLDNKTVLKVTISPTLKGFLRIQTGLKLSDLNVILMPFEKAINSVRALLMRNGLCSQVFIR